MSSLSGSPQRHPRHPKRYLLACSRSPELVERADIMEFTLDGTPISDDGRALYLERFIHGAIYEARSDVQAVVHAHAEDVLPFTITTTPRERIGEPSQLFRVLWGFCHVHTLRGAYHTRRALGEQLLSLAQCLQDPDLLLEAHHTLWTTLLSGGELAAAWPHLQQGMKLYDPQRHRTHAALYSGHDPGVCCRMQTAHSLWLFGYADQALASIQAALALAQKLAHPLSFCMALRWAAVLHCLRREVPLTQARAEAAIIIATDHGFLEQVALGTPLRDWALAATGTRDEGIAPHHQSLADYKATEATRDRSDGLALLAETFA